MTLSLAEGLVNAVATYFGTNMAAKVSALNTEYGDTYTLSDMSAYYKGEKSLQSVPGWPSCFILVPNYVVNAFKVDYLDVTHTLVVGVMVLDQDPEALRIKLYRYARALVELLKEGQVAGIGWHIAQGTPNQFMVDFSPIFTQDDNSFTADCQIRVSVKNRVMEQYS